MTRISYSSPERQSGQNVPTTPTTQRLPAITRDRFSLIRFRSPLLAESRLFSLPVGTEMFHFPTFPPHALYIQARVTGHVSSRVSPFGNPRITARLPAPRGLSQAPTSFIGSWCQGIHRVPLQTCHTQQTNSTCKHARPQPAPPEGRHQPQTSTSQKLQMLASTIQFSSNDQTPAPHPAPTTTPAAV